MSFLSSRRSRSILRTQDGSAGPTPSGLPEVPENGSSLDDSKSRRM
jgi:hypothetical protein